MNALLEQTTLQYINKSQFNLIITHIQSLFTQVTVTSHAYTQFQWEFIEPELH